MAKASASPEKSEKAQKSFFTKKSAVGKEALSKTDEREKLGLSDRERRQIRELFENVYVENRRKILFTNFLRGIFFGLGTFIGGTIVVGIVIWILTRSVDIFPWAYDFVERMLDALSRR